MSLLIKVPSAQNTVKVFTRETCEKIASMEVEERKKKLAGLITAFFQNKIPNLEPATAIAEEIGVDKELVSKVITAMHQKGMTGPDDAPNVMNRNIPAASVFYTGIIDPLADYGFEELFDFVDMRGSGQTKYDLIDVNNAITFTEVKSGERMKVYGITDGKSTVEKMILAAAIGILDDWLDYNQFWNINKAIVEARSKYYDKMATDHYAVIEASTNTQAFSTDDITTINNACAAILTDCANKGYVITGNEVFELRANINLKQRVEKAFALTFNSPNTDKNQLVHTLNRKYTTKLPATAIWVVLPKRKISRGVWSDLSAETDRDVLLRGTDVAYVGEYNMAVGEASQIKECALS